MRVKRTYYTIEGSPPEIVKHEKPPEREYVTDESVAKELLRKHKVIALAKEFAEGASLLAQPLWPSGDRFTFVTAFLRKHQIRCQGPKIKADMYKLFERTAITAFASLGTKVS